jgi:hypothetical protein
MSWLLMLVLLASIFSWVLTHRYQEEIDELKKKHNSEIDDYQDQIYDTMNEIVELETKIKDLKRRKY